MWLKLLILFCLTHVQCTQKAFIDIIQNVLKNQSVSISPKCSLQFKEVIADFSININSWSSQMLDATSIAPPDVMHLNFGDIGDFTTCIDIKTNTTNTGVLLGKHCLGYFIFINSNQSKYYKTLLGRRKPLWALCLPNECTLEDTNSIGNIFLRTMMKDQTIEVQFPETTCQTINEVEPKLTISAIITLVTLMFLVFVILGSTLYDTKCKLYSNKPCPIIIEGFSLYTNWQKVFKITKSDPHQLPCLNGIKVLSIMWIVSAHQFLKTLNNDPIVNVKEALKWSDQIYSMFVFNANLAPDTFLTLGGVLLSYGFMKSQAKNSSFNLPVFYLHRYLRLTAPYALLVLIMANFLTYLGTGPLSPYVVKSLEKNCEKYWWSALLYIQNYVNTSSRCLPASWYLDVDMQLYILSPLLLIGLRKQPKCCLTVLCFCILGVMGTSFYVAWENQLTAIWSNHYGDWPKYMIKYYFLTHTRASPWFVGLITGYLLFKIKQGHIFLKINKIYICLMWTLCFGTMFACMFGGYNSLRSETYAKWGNAFHMALVRPAWALAISWIIIACTTNYGGPIKWILSFPVYQVLNKFTYSLYLSHEVVIHLMIGSRKWPYYFSELTVVYESLGTLCFGTVCAVLMLFMAEYPVMAIEKTLLSKKPSANAT